MIPDQGLEIANHFATVLVEEARPEYCVGKIIEIEQ
jgi:hypothetical protein